jgi:hypothetical protein
MEAHKLRIGQREARPEVIEGVYPAVEGVIGKHERKQKERKHQKKNNIPFPLPAFYFHRVRPRYV